jgi:hypothetical protein
MPFAHRVLTGLPMKGVAHLLVALVLFDIKDEATLPNRTC